MYRSNALNSYKKAQINEEIEPYKLIHMLYEGAIKKINLAIIGLKNNDPKIRGENIGKAIAIISELNASLDENIKGEEITFLKSLYSTMLIELPKVSLTGDIKTLERTKRYIEELKKIWETTVMTVKPESDNIHYNNKQERSRQSFAV
jgi:flagellar protein FliS